MYLHILRDRGVERLYVSRSVRIGEKVVSQNVRSPSLGFSTIFF